MSHGVAKVQYTPCGKPLASLPGDESGAFVGFEDQRRSVLPGERTQYGCGRIGAHVGHRLPSKLIGGRLVKDREDVGARETSHGSRVATESRARYFRGVLFHAISGAKRGHSVRNLQRSSLSRELL